MDKDLNDEKSNLYEPSVENKVPIVYHEKYNISFFGMEKLHPFDSCKWSRIVKMLTDETNLKREDLITPVEASETDLLNIHTKKYLNSLQSSFTVAGITELAPVALLPNFVVQWKLLSPFRYHTGGTVLAAKVSLDRGWSIHVGGGFHHASRDQGGGFCAYADITLAIKMLKNEYSRVENVLIVDLDAHQGNGHERDFMEDSTVYIMDVYNAFIYPGDIYARGGISKNIELESYTEDHEYLTHVQSGIEESLSACKPDFILYNAGTDVLKGDPLGRLNVSSQGIIKRDEIIFSAARLKNIPIAMVTSGGYQGETARVIADSIKNLNEKGIIELTTNSPQVVRSDS